MAPDVFVFTLTKNIQMLMVELILIFIGTDKWFLRYLCS